MPLWMTLLGCYPIGSLDFAVVVSRAHGVGIHGERSGAPGPLPDAPATLGRGQAVMVSVGNALKGLIAAAIAPLVSVLLVVLPVMWQGVEGWPLIPLGGMLGLIVWRHFPDLGRMVAGPGRRVTT